MFTTIIGLICGVGVIMTAVFIHDSSSIIFTNLPAALITIGGTISASMIYFSPLAMKDAFFSFLEIFKFKRNKMENIIDVLLEIDKKFHHTEMITILDSGIIQENPFLAKGLTLVADNVEPEEIKGILTRYSNSLTTQKKIAERVFSVSGSFAPMFGMAGTVIGLISMLSKIDNPSAIPAAMGLALITTLYGLILAALFFIPISGKIRDNNHQETRIRKVMIEGVLAIQKRENAEVLRERLNCF
ncbi:MAG: MotA/TolQ/ExbB proton channel family protein [Candidatus Marinimicrobia bacterium]|nr:MotA/TolQ/ExbB proton channel family protein [Candidatus Neomarinimicrobiota bacterium]